jgi:hypothetical protein
MKTTKNSFTTPRRSLETQSVLTGEAVPVLGKGIVTVDTDSSAIDGSASSRRAS